MSASELRTINGYVQALPKVPGKDDKARVAVVTDDGTAYHILHKNQGVPLAENINGNVEVTGHAEPWSGDEDDKERGDFVLTVTSFRLTDGFDDPWYDDIADER